MMNETKESLRSIALCIAMASFCLRYTVIGASYYNQTSNYLQRETSLEGKDDFRGPESLQHRHHRKSKLFPLFTFIRFANEICKTTSEETGVCYTRAQCNSLGGVAQGNCASGLGVCCRFVASCGAIVYQNGTSFQNPHYPSSYTPPGGSDICQIRIRKQHNVCQLRLNFIAFEIEGPIMASATGTGGGATVMNDAGMCKTDSLAITSSGAAVPSLCGNMNGHHLYVDFGSSDTITLNLLLGGGTITSQRERTWNIEILTIPCNSIMRAPTGCLQYYTGVSGEVESFNFQGSYHLANLDYAVCVRIEDGMRFIDWLPCAPGSVRFGGATAATPPVTNSPCPATGAAGANAANSDYLIIPNGISFPPTGTTTTPIMSISDRFCDTNFYAPGSYVRSSAKPFTMYIHTDAMDGSMSDMSSIGYCLRWQQNPQ